jgi:hypothetical protein
MVFNQDVSLLWLPEGRQGGGDGRKSDNDGLNLLWSRTSSCRGVENFAKTFLFLAFFSSTSATVTRSTSFSDSMAANGLGNSSTSNDSKPQFSPYAIRLSYFKIT